MDQKHAYQILLGIHPTLGAERAAVAIGSHRLQVQSPPEVLHNCPGKTVPLAGRMSGRVDIPRVQGSHQLHRSLGEQPLAGKCPSVQHHLIEGGEVLGSRIHRVFGTRVSRTLPIEPGVAAENVGARSLQFAVDQVVDHGNPINLVRGRENEAVLHSQRLEYPRLQEPLERLPGDDFNHATHRGNA